MLFWRHFWKMGDTVSKKQTQGMGEPWRKFEKDGGWTEKFRDKLLKDIECLEHQEGVEQARIAIFGIVGSGKSSFINSIATIDKQRITARINIGCADESLTRKLGQFVPKRISSNFVLLDTMGIEGIEGGLSMPDCKSVIGGVIPIGHEFKSDEPVSQKPTNEYSMLETSHCIVIVMDATLIGDGSLNEGHLSKFESLQKSARDIDVRTLLLLTKIDLACPEVKKDLRKVYTSRKIRDIAIQAAEKIKVPLMNVFPVKNYDMEADLDDDMNILLLLALRQMVRYANDRIEFIADQKMQKNNK